TPWRPPANARARQRVASRARQQRPKASVAGRRLQRAQKVARPSRPAVRVVAVLPARVTIGSPAAQRLTSLIWENSVSRGECRKFRPLSAKMYRFTAILFWRPSKTRVRPGLARLDN